MRTIAHIDDTQEIIYTTFVFSARTILKTKAKKWYTIPKYEILFSITHKDNIAACLKAHELLSQELGSKGRLEYSFYDSFALDKVISEGFAQDPQAMLSILRSFPSLDFDGKLEAYRAMYQFTMNKMDKERDLVQELQAGKEGS